MKKGMGSMMVLGSYFTTMRNSVTVMAATSHACWPSFLWNFLHGGRRERVVVEKGIPDIVVDLLKGSALVFPYLPGVQKRFLKADVISEESLGSREGFPDNTLASRIRYKTRP